MLCFHSHNICFNHFKVQLITFVIITIYYYYLIPVQFELIRIQFGLRHVLEKLA